MKAVLTHANLLAYVFPILLLTGPALASAQQEASVEQEGSGDTVEREPATVEPATDATAEPATADPPRRRRARWDLLAPGIVSLGSAYIGWVVTAFLWNLSNVECARGTTFSFCAHNGRGPDGDDILRSLIPLVGPWLSVASSETMNGADYAVPVISGIAQAAGLTMMVLGLVLPAMEDSDVQISVSPGGLSVSGRF